MSLSSFRVPTPLVKPLWQPSCTILPQRLAQWAYRSNSHGTAQKYQRLDPSRACKADTRDRNSCTTGILSLPHIKGWHDCPVVRRALATLLAVSMALCPVHAYASPEDLGARPEEGAPAQPASELLPYPTEFPPLSPIQELPIQEAVLSNGVRVFMIEDHEVPLVKASILIPGGQRSSPQDKIGLASISVGVMRSGGSIQHPGTELDEDLEQLAAGMEGGALPEAFALGFQCLKEDTAHLLDLFSELLTSPVLPEDEISLSKGQLLNLLEHRNDTARIIPKRELNKLIYGPDSVYARTPTTQQVASISRDDVEAYLNQWVHPGGAILGVLGDFDSAQMQQLLEEKLGSWQGKGLPATKPPTSPLPEPTEPTLHLVDRPGATQSVVAMGELGVQLSDPDTPALDILNEILNSFGGRLFNEIRSREGLAYSVSGGFQTTAVDHRGLFLAGGETAAPGEFILALERVLLEATQVAPSQSILEAAKAKTLNSFVFNFSSSDAQLQRLLTYTLQGLPQDYLFSYKERVQAVTAEDVLDAAKRHLHPLEQQVVVAGDAGVIKDQLSKQSRKIVPLQLSAV